MDVKFARLEQRVTALEEDAKEFHKLLEPIKTETVRHDEHYKQIISTLEEVKKDVKDLKDRPSKFFDYIAMCCISAIIALLFKIFGG
jgi:archaellum component FlaC